MKIWEAISKVIDDVQDHTTLVVVEQRDLKTGTKARMVFSTREYSDLTRKLRETFEAYAANPEED